MYNNLRLAIGMTLKFYTSEAKVLKLKVKKLLGVILMFVEVTGKKLVGEAFPPPAFWIGLILVCLVVIVNDSRKI